MDSDNEFIKLFPKNIIFNQDIYNKLNEQNIIIIHFF